MIIKQLFSTKIHESSVLFQNDSESVPIQVEQMRVHCLGIIQSKSNDIN